MRRRYFVLAFACVLLLAVMMLGGCGDTAADRSADDLAEATTAVVSVEATTAAIPEATTAAPVEAEITEAQAKDIALKDAQLGENDVTFTQCVLSQDDGRLEYELEFIKDDQEYSYDIDAQTGEIISKDQEMADDIVTQDDSQKAVADQSGDQISEGKALEIALDNAGLTEKDIDYSKAQLDNEDGKTVYEVEFYVGKTEYSYEIDAVSGEIYQAEKEIDD